LISAATRLQGIFFWDFFIYLIEGLVFLRPNDRISLRAGVPRCPSAPCLDIAARPPYVIEALDSMTPASEEFRRDVLQPLRDVLKLKIRPCPVCGKARKLMFLCRQHE